ncbi:MAG: TraB/GumN family protein [Bacteroidia bacterium]|nr:TraB/GumN family protein [Bacteroidia bacterium]
MLLRLVIFLYIAGCWVPVLGQNNSPEVVDLLHQPIRVSPVKNVLWEISGPRLSRPSYLYGILYKVPADAFFLVPGLDVVVKEVDRLVMEVHPVQMDKDHLYRGTVPIDSTLEELLTKREYATLQTFVRDSLSAVSLYKLMGRYQPALLSWQFMCDYCLGYSEANPPINYEQYLYQVTKLPVTPLTNGWAREAWLEAYSFGEQTNMLMNTLAHKRRLCLNYHDLLREYWKQDLEMVWLLSKNIPEFGSNTSTLIEARNADWLERLPGLMEREQLLIAVHAVQLPGEYGLIHLLKKAGYQLHPVLR